MSAAMSTATPKNAEARMMTRMRARSRRAASRAPVSEPIARIELSTPYSPAPRPNSTAMVDEKIGKFMPNAPIRNTMTNTITRSGRSRDVAEARDELARERAPAASGAGFCPLSMASATSTARNVAALMMNTQPDPTSTMRNPATAGPMMRARVERRRVERDRVRHVRARDEVGDEGLPRGRVDGVHDAEREGEDVEVPELGVRRG